MPRFRSVRRRLPETRRGAAASAERPETPAESPGGEPSDGTEPGGGHRAARAEADEPWRPRSPRPRAEDPLSPGGEPSPPMRPGVATGYPRARACVPRARGRPSPTAAEPDPTAPGSPSPTVPGVRAEPGRRAQRRTHADPAPPSGRCPLRRSSRTGTSSRTATRGSGGWPRTGSSTSRTGTPNARSAPTPARPRRRPSPTSAASTTSCDAAADLLLQRVTQTDISAKDAQEGYARLAEQCQEPNAVGDLAALREQGRRDRRHGRLPQGRGRRAARRRARGGPRLPRDARR